MTSEKRRSSPCFLFLDHQLLIDPRVDKILRKIWPKLEGFCFHIQHPATVETLLTFLNQYYSVGSLDDMTFDLNQYYSVGSLDDMSFDKTTGCSAKLDKKKEINQSNDDKKTAINGSRPTCPEEASFPLRTMLSAGRKSIPFCIENIHDFNTLNQFRFPFILGLIQASMGPVLGCLDPHACHERILLEAYQNQSKIDHEHSLAMILPKAAVLIWKKWHQRMQSYGLVGSITKTSCTLEYSVVYQHLGQSRLIQLVLDTLHWLEQHPNLSTTPLPIHECLSSKACRNAVTLGQHLSMNTAKQLVQDLMQCDYPFQCGMQVSYSSRST